MLIVLGVGVFAFVCARLRAWAADLFELVPLFGEGGVRRTLLFADCVGTAGGLLVALMLPLVGLVVSVAMLAGLIGVGLVLRRATRGARGPCAACGAELHLAASRCPRCGAQRVARRLGLFGRVLEGAPSDVERHRLALLSVRRCPSCAERLGRKNHQVVCEACGAKAFPDADAARAFVRYAGRRLLVLLPLLAALALVPVLGLGAVVLLTAIAPSGALAGFVGLRGRLGVRALHGLAWLALALLQPVPLVGAFAAVGLVGVTHAWRRRSFLASVPEVERSGGAPVAEALPA